MPPPHPSTAPAQRPRGGDPNPNPNPNGPFGTLQASSRSRRTRRALTTRARRGSAAVVLNSRLGTFSEPSCRYVRAHGLRRDAPEMRPRCGQYADEIAGSSAAALFPLATARLERTTNFPGSVPAGGRCTFPPTARSARSPRRRRDRPRGRREEARCAATSSLLADRLNQMVELRRARGAFCLSAAPPAFAPLEPSTHLGHASPGK